MTAIETDIQTGVSGIVKRPRRNRKSEALRQLLTETRLHPSDFIAPFFVMEGKGRSEEIASMPGITRTSLNLLLRQVEEVMQAGVRSVNLFAYVPEEKKDRWGAEALRRDNMMATAITALKREFPELLVIADIALDPYTTHGHDGVIDEDGTVLNDPTLEVLAQMALVAAEAGADIVAPSDMMDGRVGHIRGRLDLSGFQDVGILSYTVKFVSAFYGPFRDALGSAPKIGDKKSYQVNPANRSEALLECRLDEEEGADMLLVKPALPYLDVIMEFKRVTALPVGAYHVSGEYAMVMAAAERGWIDGNSAMAESLLAIKRAGADFILSYAACRPDFLRTII